MSSFFFKNLDFPLNILISKGIIDRFLMAEFQVRLIGLLALSPVLAGMKEIDYGKPAIRPMS